MLAAACVKKPVPETPGTIVVPEGEHEHEHGGNVKFVFSHVAGSQPLVLDKNWYLTGSNDSVKFSVFNYYLSNFVFVDENGKEYKQPESYYLIKESKPESKNFVIKGIPEGKYKQLRLLIGVDSTRNVSGAQTGALDPANNMFWDWNTGYIMLMIEGISPQFSSSSSFALHFGGFKKVDLAIREVVLDFPQVLEIKTGNTNIVSVETDILDCFITPTSIKMNQVQSLIISGDLNAVMADNYADMMTVTNVE